MLAGSNHTYKATQLNATYRKQFLTQSMFAKLSVCTCTGHVVLWQCICTLAVKVFNPHPPSLFSLASVVYTFFMYFQDAIYINNSCGISVCMCDSVTVYV